MLAFLFGPLYFPSMRRLLRKLFVLVTSLALVVGMVQQSVFAADESCPLSSRPNHSAHTANAGHAQHHHGAPEQKKNAACAKCCGVCLSAPAVSPVAMVAAIAVAPSRIQYALKSQRFAGRPVVVDPGIPKRTV
jgi:hypothetical protein